MEKECSKCKKTLNLSQFYEDKSKLSGFSSHCKPCKRAQTKIYRSIPEVSEKANARSKTWYEKNKERQKLYASENRPNSLDRALKRYDLTKYEYNLLLHGQDNKCAICKAQSGGKSGGRLVIDHCHETGEVRGLLCHSCNRGLGMFRDKLSLIVNAAKYLKETQVE